MKRLKVWMILSFLGLGAQFFAMNSIQASEKTEDQGDKKDSDKTQGDAGTDSKTKDDAAKSATQKLIDKIPNVTLKLKLKEGTAISFNDIPGVNKLPLPDSMKNALGNIKLENPQVTLSKTQLVILGTVDFFGNKVTGQIKVAKDATGTTGYSLLVGLPGTFKFSNISSVFKSLDDIQISAGTFIMSDAAYTDPVWGKVQKGISFISTIKVGGVIQKLTNMVGSDLNELTLKGLITPTLAGSKLTVTLPGKIRFGNKTFPNLIETTGLSFFVAITETVPGVPSGVGVGISTGFELNIPGQDTLTLTGSIEAGPTDASMSAWMDGMVKFPKFPLEIGQLKAQATIDYATAAASGGLLSLSGVGVGGAVQVGSKKLDVDIYFVLSATVDVLLNGKFEGGLYLEDLVDFLSDVIKVASGKKIDLASAAKGKIPDIGLDNATLYVAPKDMTFAGTNYTKGMIIKGSGVILGTKVAFDANVNDKGINMSGSMSPTTIGPITISGDDAKSPASVAIAVDPKNLQNLVSANIDGRVSLNILGGASAATKVALTTKGATFSASMNLFKDFQATVSGGIPNIKNPIDGTLTIDFQQTALKKISESLLSGASSLLNEAKKIQQAKQSAQQKLDSANEKLEAAKKSFSPLDDLKAQLDAATKECTGK